MVESHEDSIDGREWLMPNIVLGLTGSVASIVAEELLIELQKLGDVSVVLTSRAHTFARPERLRQLLSSPDAAIYLDEDEWQWPGDADAPSTGESSSRSVRREYRRDDPVLHIELRRAADVLVVAPLSANTLAKFACGLCDNLLTSLFRAWDWSQPVVAAPAMNTLMWDHPVTREQLERMERLFGERWCVVPPQVKRLACGDEGDGAMASVESIVDVVRRQLRRVE